MVLYVVSEEDYLAHYGRKGMKWYQHIFGEDSSYSKRVAKFKEDVKSASNAQKIKTAGKLLVGEALGAIGGRKLGGKIGVAKAFWNMKTVTTHIGISDGAGLAINKVIKKYIDAPTLGEAFRALEIGSSAGLAVGVALPILGYGAYKGYKYLNNRNTKGKKSTSKKKKISSKSTSSADFKNLDKNWW